VPVAAFAHARLLISDPAPGAVLDTLPATVDLVFTEPVTPAGRGINVYGPDGRLASNGSARARGDGLSVGVSGSLAGTYAVVWTVVASDTHPSRGEFTFSVGHASPVQAPGFGGGEVGLVSPVGLVLQSLGRWLHFAGFALGVGAATYALFVARDPRPLRIAGFGVALLLVAEPLALFAQTASLDPSQTIDGDALTGALASPFGRVLGLRLGGALLLWAVLGALRPSLSALGSPPTPTLPLRGREMLRWAVPGLGVALALVDATAAHATPALPQPLGLMLNALHVAAMAVWLGGVAAYVVAPSGAFGRLAGWSLGLLVLSGAALALLHLSSPLELLTTPYGAALAIKLPVVAIGLFFAWRARHRWELATLLVVIAAASVLVSLPPPR
jgi:copper transport protein